MVHLNHECLVFTEISALMHEFHQRPFDLLIFDWHPSTITGWTAIQWLLSDLNGAVPVLFVTNCFEKRHMIEGLIAKVDDFIVKPFQMSELKVRVTALLRRTQPRQDAAHIVIGPYCFSTASRQLHLDGQHVKLRPLEYELALLLFKNVGQVLTREYLLKTLWSRANEEVSRSLDTHISHVRSKLNLFTENGFSLSAVYGLGYRLEAAAAAPVSVTPLPELAYIEV